METPARVLSLPVEPRPEAASVLTRTLSGKRGHEGLMGEQGRVGGGVCGVLLHGHGRPTNKCACPHRAEEGGLALKKRRLSQSPVQQPAPFVRSSSTPSILPGSRRKPDGLWSAAMRFMAAQAQTNPSGKGVPGKGHPGAGPQPYVAGYGAASHADAQPLAEVSGGAPVHCGTGAAPASRLAPQAEAWPSASIPKPEPGPSAAAPLPKGRLAAVSAPLLEQVGRNAGAVNLLLRRGLEIGQMNGFLITHRIPPRPFLPRLGAFWPPQRNHSRTNTKSR